ncbi:ABC transporter permease [Pigmentiphaga aceris]|uniref:ABC transporter permease n=1 Tax=Pigmentiphaga aceris TaxID=1940612 RepID=A0A5C0B355_9BURK|nr:ABC transporter permease [Pigmentiphaga aceris]QEI07047.1 ABC transporter permease [Pigmentiphaga aceris]
MTDVSHRAAQVNAASRQDFPATPSAWQRFARNRGALAGAVLLAALAVTAALASWWFGSDPLRMVGSPELWPAADAAFPLGTDSMGRDIAAMMAHGARTTLLMGLGASAVATMLGLLIGAAAGYYGGWVDDTLMRLQELFQIMPSLIFIVTLISILGPTIGNITLAIGIVSWPSIARLTRAEFLSLREREFVTAGRALGMGGLRLIFREILPNALPPVIVLSSLTLATALLFEAVIAFLGLGDPNVASWGRLIGEGRTLIRTSWYICAIPGVAIMLAVLALNLVGDGLNDAFNPQLDKHA